MSFITATNISKLSIAHGFFDRTDGQSQNEFASRNVKYDIEDEAEAVSANRQTCLQDLGLAGKPLVFARLCHGNSVFKVESARSEDVLDTDALITDQPGVVIGLSTADCIPILLADSNKQAVGIVHAGWRGLQNGVIQKTIEALRREYGTAAENIVAAIGPAIKQANYEIGEEVAGHFDRNFIREEKGQLMLDLTGLAEQQLQQAGLKDIDTSDIDVFENTDFYSFRRDDGKTGRQLSAICLNA